MKKIIPLAIFIIVLSGLRSVSPEALSEERQQVLLDELLYLRGEGPMPASLEGVTLPHCGNEITFAAFINRDNFTGKYAALYESLDRPDLPNAFVSPDSLFRIHYTVTGDSAVHQPGVDTLDGGDGIPDYVNKVAEIADSVWAFEVDSLGFPAPPSDGTSGGDSLMDIYIYDLGSSFYGKTEPETVLTNQSVTSYIVIDNDFDMWPYNLSNEMNRRLDAARVTVAHEFFHTIHYGMDYTEYEDVAGYYSLYWWEMSATWMEEMAFDDVNDYYFYLPAFLEYPWIGLQGVPVYNILHQYGGALFPLYLSEKFDTVLIRDIWERCRDYGTGSQFPRAANDVLLEYTDSTYTLLSAYNEMSVWNLFTGSRADQAPAGYKFSEAEFYYEIPDTGVFLSFTQYEGLLMIWEWADTLENGDPFILSDGTPITSFKAFMPQNLSAHYLNMQNISLIPDTFSMYFAGDPDIDWMISLVGFPVGGTGQAAILDTFTQKGPHAIRFDTPSDLYRNIVAIPTPVSTDIYSFPEEYGYSVIFLDSLVPSPGESFVISNPYPNPIRVDSPDDSVSFDAVIYTSSFSGKAAKLEVTIFNIAGEKIIRVPHDPHFENYFNKDRITVGWKLDNQSGVKVSAGVYLAYCELIFADGTPSVSEKRKVAVIR